MFKQPLESVYVTMSPVKEEGDYVEMKDMPPPLPAKTVRNVSPVIPPLSPQILAMPVEERQAVYNMLNECSRYLKEHGEYESTVSQIPQFPVS
ncbi:hypothetical protein AL542_15170 [Grimontia hollisae]|uniref:hypothetical protein n=1 Tax=Grimontia hollisae TaxID=673 RepID=UPI00058E6638|nr:hypothetical protein [Grimontia hollisae]AMG31543.1 hypothetical protein AL542_15170 [Grimontia hollisae]STO45386.1 Uncharacterised protein [Grimontia hollisae]